jgi:hypothetical protein
LVKSTVFCDFAAENRKKMTGKLPQDDHRELFRTRAILRPSRPMQMTEAQKSVYKEKMSLYRRAVNQQKTGKNKVCSFHKPHTQCITKGKPHKPYEFGNKAGLITSGKKGKKNHFGDTGILIVSIFD